MLFGYYLHEYQAKERNMDDAKTIRKLQMKTKLKDNTI